MSSYKYTVRKQEKMRKLTTMVALVCLFLMGGWYVLTEAGAPQEIVLDTFSATEDRVTDAAAQSEKRIEENKIENNDTAAGENETERDSAGQSTELAEPALPKGIRGDGLVDLNHATAEELQTLPSIGPATAELIVRYREENGGFAAIEEIQNVKRIGEKTFAKLKDKICV